MTVDTNRKELFDALRCGEYPQGVGSLCINYDVGSYYCVLGVACDVSGKGEWVEIQHYDQKLGYKSDGGSEIVYSMPNDVVEHYGFHCSEGCAHPKSQKNFSEAIARSSSDAAEWLKEKSKTAPNPTAVINGITLTRLNDVFRMPFPLIADLLEEFEDYFFKG